MTTDPAVPREDVRARLAEALDAAERLARAATPGPWRHNPHKQWLTHEDPGMRKMLTWMGARGEEFVGAGPLTAPVCVAGTGPADDPQSMADAALIASWDPSTVLRLIERDRQLLVDEEKAKRSFDEKVRGWPDTSASSEIIAATARLNALNEQLESAAAFWLGTQEES